MPEALVFKPKKKFLFDVLFFLNIVFLLVYASQFVPLIFLLLGAAVANGAVACLWVYAIQNVFKVKFQDNILSGPGDGFLRTSIHLRKVDHRKLGDRSPREKFWGIYTISALDGTKIHLYRHLIGRGPTKQILSMIEKFPFREAPKE